MPSSVPDSELSEAIFQAVQDGSYPEDELIVSAELPSSAVKQLSELLDEARADVKASISELSRLSAPDVDGWIIQAKQLRTDIQQSQEDANEIVKLSATGRELETQSDDAARKIELLQTEVAFNGSLVSTLQNIQAVRELLESAQSAGLGGNLLESVSLIGQAQVKLDQLEGCGNTTLVDLIRVKIADIRNTTAKTLTESWNNLVHVNVEESSITINQEDQRLTLRTVVDGLDTLDLLKDKIIVFQKTFDKLIITPRLSPPSDSSVSYIVFDKDTTRISHPQSSTKSTRIFTDITSTLEFLSSRLPEAFYVPFSALWIPILASKLISGPLPAAVSTDLSELKEFQDMLEEVKIFSASIQRLCPRASQELNSWVQNAPNVWLDRRSEYSLNGIRRTLKRGLGKSRAVERVETQVLTREENAFAGPTGNDDWDASWSDNDDNGQDDEEEKNTQDLETAQKRTTESNEHNDDEDSGGWGFEEEEETENDTRQEEHQKEEPDDGGDAWGWSDEDDKPNDGPSQSKQPSPSKAQTVQNNGHPLAKSSEQREVTLIETYHISALPEQILEIIVQDVEDADTLAVSKQPNPVSAAAKGLFSVPKLSLSMYRASAPTYYEQDVNGNMYLYNDSLYIVGQLRQFVDHHASRHGQFNELDLDADISALEQFGKRAYGKAMESQRTILSDIFEGAQGFANCTVPPFKEQCDLAVSSMVDHIRNLHGQWKSVLSNSALLQSIGSLLSSVTNKMIIAIEDMPDIEDADSQQLAAFCNRITSLDDLFITETPGSEGGQPVPMPIVYTPGWLKLQYLSNILESTLADINYMWAEGELSLEFEPSEVIDLIEALFADSEYRRKAINEIRKSPRRSDQI